METISFIGRIDSIFYEYSLPTTVILIALVHLICFGGRPLSKTDTLSLCTCMHQDGPFRKVKVQFCLMLKISYVGRGYN